MPTTPFKPVDELGCDSGECVFGRRYPTANDAVGCTCISGLEPYALREQIIKLTYAAAALETEKSFIQQRLDALKISTAE